MPRPKPRTKYYVYPYGPSNSARAVANSLGGKLLRRVGTTYRPRAGDILINWGSRTLPNVLTNNVPRYTILNKPEAVNIGSSKILTFEALQRHNVRTVLFTRDQARARDWLGDNHVVGRNADRGQAGAGITFYHRDTPPAQLRQHLFYTKYFRKEREFRVHVMNGRAIFTQEKLKREGVEFEHDRKYIRSHHNGWVFAFNHLRAKPSPQGLEDVAIGACNAVGLDFCGVDIGWNARHGFAVFEVNTAPGIEETSLDRYTTNFLLY